MNITIELHHRAIFVGFGSREVWCELLRKNEQAPYPHPMGRRWGLHRSLTGRGAKQTAFYVGRIFATTASSH